MRYPAVAGQFYSGNPEELRRQVEKCYTSPIGPGAIPKLMEGPRSIVGAVCPHAGFMYSGPVAAHVFNALANDGFPETFIIIGPNHTGMGAMVATTVEDFSMPMGVVSVQKDLAERETGAVLLPVFYFTQLLALALGLEADVCGFDKHVVDPLPLLSSEGFV